MHGSRADFRQVFLFSYCGYPLGLLSSLDASIDAALRHDAVLADERFTDGTRFDPQSKPAAAAWAERATSRLGRAAASQRIPILGSVAPGRNWRVA